MRSTTTPSNQSRPSIVTLIQRFENSWSSGGLATACELVDRHFDRLPDPAPLRVAIAKTLHAHHLTRDAVKILELTILHYAYSGFFFRALQTFRELSTIEAPSSEILDTLWNLYGPESPHITNNRSIPLFPEPSRKAIDLSEDSQVSQDFDSLTDQFLLYFLRDAALRKKALRNEPKSLPRLPLFSTLPKEAFLELIQQLECETISSLRFLDSPNSFDGIAWTIGRNFWLTSDKDSFSIPTGTILGLNRTLSQRFFPQYKIISHSSSLLRLPSDALKTLSDSWPELTPTLQRIALASVLETRLTHHQLIQHIAPDARPNFLKRVQIDRIEQGAFVSPEGEESAIILLLNGSLEVAGTTSTAEEEPPPIGNLLLSAPNVVGACSLVIDKIPNLLYRAKTDSIIARVSPEDSRNLIGEQPDVSLLLIRLSNHRLRQLDL